MKNLSLALIGCFLAAIAPCRLTAEISGAAAKADNREPLDEAARELDREAAHPDRHYSTPALDALHPSPSPPGAASAEALWQASLPRSIDRRSYIRGDYVSHGWDRGLLFSAPVLVLHGCQPHNCGDNNFVAIVHLPSRKAIGLAVQDNGVTPRREVYVGSPSALQRDCLDGMVGDYTATGCGPVVPHAAH